MLVNIKLAEPVVVISPRGQIERRSRSASPEP